MIEVSLIKKAKGKAVKTYTSTMLDEFFPVNVVHSSDSRMITFGLHSVKAVTTAIARFEIRDSQPSPQ